jgi:16S rRNA processing protein RimM
VLAAEPLAADAGELTDGEFWVHELVGSRVVDRAGVGRGSVIAVEANPAHDLLVLDGGALVPMVFVVEQRDGEVVIDPPDGLFDL